jgi:hypothetical protein
MPLLLGVLAVLALGAGVTVAILTSSGGTPTAQPAPTSAPAAPTAGPQETTPPPATTAPTTTPPTTAASAPTSAAAAPADAVAFVQNYYGLLPGDTESAWQLLGSEAQRQSNGRSGYDRFWSGVASVTVQNARQTGANTVEGTVVFTRRDGSTSSEPYRFVVGTGSDGQPIMESFSQL